MGHICQQHALGTRGITLQFLLLNPCPTIQRKNYNFGVNLGEHLDRLHRSRRPIIQPKNDLQYCTVKQHCHKTDTKHFGVLNEKNVAFV
jgi:hypothetical protein